MHEPGLSTLETADVVLTDVVAYSKMSMDSHQSTIERIRRKPAENHAVRRMLTKGILAAGAVVLLLSAGSAFALALSMQSAQSTPTASQSSQSGTPSGAAQQPDATATGALVPVSVTTNVKDADLFIDGRKRDEVQHGDREWKINLAVGTHDIRVAKDKYQSASMDVDVKENFETDVQLTLLPTKLQLRPLPRNDSDLIKDLLERRWKRAFESGNLQEVRAIWPSVPVATENAIMSARGITLELTCSPLTNNDMAIAKCTQTATYNGRNASGVVVFKVRKTGQTWEISGSM